MPGWESFFVAEVGASAALAGLVFVGVSINLTTILQYQNLPDRVVKVMVLLVGVLLISSLMLIPSQPARLIGAELLVIGIVLWGVVVVIERRELQHVDAKYRHDFARHVVVDQAATLPFVVAGLVAVAGSDDFPHWLATGILLAIVDAFVEAWILLIEIRR